MTKPIRAYAIKSGDVILPWTIRMLKKEAINEIVDRPHIQSWEHAKAKYYSCVPIEIREVEK